MTNKIGVLINLTQILKILSIFKKINNYGANLYTYYYAPLFISSSIVNNIPVIKLFSVKEYITFELTIPDENFLKNVNLINCTSYYYTYDDTVVFGSTDKSIEFFNQKLSVGDKIKIVFTSSKIIASEYENKGYLVSKFPIEYLEKSTFNFLIRIGNLDGKYNPGQFITKSKILLKKSPLDEDCLDPFTTRDIIQSFPHPLNSKLSYNGNEDLLENLLDLYSNTKKMFLSNNFTELPTFLYLQNIPQPNVDYPFQSFYDSISVKPYINILANNTGICYFNSNLIDLTQYIGKIITIVSVNQEKFGYGLTSNIQIYNQNNLSIIESYFTSINIPPMNYPTYPYYLKYKIDEYTNDCDDECSNDYTDKFPIINIKQINVDEQLKKNITNIYIVERVEYNPINFSHSDNYLVPRFSIFVEN